MKPILRFRDPRTSYVAIATVLAGASWLVIACGDPPQPTGELGTVDEELRRVPGERRDLPSQRKDETPEELKISDCLKFKGTITYNANCHETTTTTQSGGKLVGRFSCKIGDANKCIDENERQQPQ